MATQRVNNLKRGIIATIGLIIIGIIFYYIFVYSKEGFQTDKPTIVFYHMNGCGWCQKMKPEWEKCKKLAKSKNISTEEYEASEVDPKVLRSKNIDGFPTIIIRNGSSETKYSGERTADAMINYVLNLS